MPDPLADPDLRARFDRMRIALDQMNLDVDAQDGLLALVRERLDRHDARREIADLLAIGLLLNLVGHPEASDLVIQAGNLVSDAIRQAHEGEETPHAD